jgi:hypothetical protein
LRSPLLPRIVLASVLVATLLVGCDAEERTAPSPSRRGASSSTASADTCPEFREPRRAGSVSGLGVDEISGVEASERHDVLWVHEDSGAEPVIYALEPDGSPVGSVSIDGAEHVDWEDIALAGGRLWIGDIGDNLSARIDGIQVYWFLEPDPTATQVVANTLELSYEDGPHDAEALLIDARHDALYVITKELSLAEGTVFRASIDGIVDGDELELERVSEVPIGIVTAADTSALGVVVKSYGKARLFPWSSERDVGLALQADACPVPLGGGESVAYREADRRFYAIPEGGQPPVWVTEIA